MKAVAKSQRLNYSAAVDVILSTPEGRDVFDAQRRMEKVNSKVGFSEVHMEMEDNLANIQKGRRGGDNPGGLPTDYEIAVRNIQMQYPHLTQSQVHDEARKANPDAWAQHKAVKLGGGKPLPRQAVGEQYQENDADVPTTSQRSPTPRPPMWQSDHSGNRPPNTPDRTPAYRPDGSPQVKRSAEPDIRGWWESHSPAAQDDLVRIVSKSSGLSDEAARRVLEHM